jgi:hypothetical protein
MRDYLRGTDLAQISEELCLTYEVGPPRISGHGPSSTQGPPR